jgi:hypothetical protein
MKWPRVFGIVDLGILTLAAVALFLPPREMYASSSYKGDEAYRFAIALAEARTIARPDDGKHVDDFTRAMGETGFKDWAVEAALDGSERAKDSPTRWRALLAASVAYVDRLDVIPALDYANRALAACETAREKGGADACPSWEEVRMRLYHRHLDAGVASGINPRQDPGGFRAAGESGIRQIRLKERTGSAPSP